MEHDITFKTACNLQLVFQAFTCIVHIWWKLNQTISVVQQFGCCSADKEILHLLWNFKVHYHDHKNSQQDHVLRHLNPVTAYFLTICLNIICSRCGDWLRAGRPRGRSLCPGRVKNFLFTKSSRPGLGSMQPPIQWVLGALSPGV
jgi:hypothetical protein